jgi:putative membrane protein
MKNQTPSNGRRFGRVVATSLSAAALFAAASLYAQNSSSSSSSTPSSSSNRTRSDTSSASGAYEPAAGTTSSSSSAKPSDTGFASRASDTSTLSRSDRRFVTKAVELNNEEVRLSELAAQQATNPEVRSFAQQLVNEHSQVGTELSAIANRKGVIADPSDYDQRATSKLSKKTGVEFDKAYLDKMADAHEDAVDLFEKAAKNAKDPEVQAFAAKQLPTLKEHQQHAKVLEKTVK